MQERAFIPLRCEENTTCVAENLLPEAALHACIFCKKTALYIQVVGVLLLLEPYSLRLEAP